jgi:carboxypeptidase D
MLDRFMGVDIASIGGKPASSKIDGAKAGLETSVGGHPNSTVAEEQEKEKLKQAEWKAYYKSGEAVLVVVAIAAGVWGWFVWRDRRRRRGYKGLSGMGNGHTRMNGSGDGALESFRRKRLGNEDVEAGDFDESELDDLNDVRPRGSRDGEMERERYSVGGVSDDEDEDDGMATPKAKG